MIRYFWKITPNATATNSNQKNIPKNILKFTDINSKILSNGIWGNPEIKNIPEFLIPNDSDGITIDENIDIRKILKEYSIATTEKAILINKNNKKIIIWHSVHISKDLAKLYKNDNIDYIFVESYWPWKCRLLLWLFFKLNWHTCKKYDILNKLVYILGINQLNRPKFIDALKTWNLWVWLPWCNNEKTLNKQLTYIKNKCKNIAGIGYFITSITPEFLKIVDETTLKYFP